MLDNDALLKLIFRMFSCTFLLMAHSITGGLLRAIAASAVAAAAPCNSFPPLSVKILRIA